MTTDCVFVFLFFIVQRMLSNEHFISCISHVTEFHCVTNGVNRYLNPRELRWMGVALLRNKRIWHLVKPKSVSVPWQFAKHSGVPR